MKENKLKKFLSRLGLENTVLYRDKENGGYSFDFHIDTKNKLSTIKPDAVYVFNKQPFILFFDLTDIANQKSENEIHKKVWSFDNSPIIFIIKSTEIQIFNALNYIKDKNGNDGKLEELNLTEEERDNRFSFWNLQSGETWKWFQNDYLENTKKKETRKRVNERLFQNIKEVRQYLTDTKEANHLDDKQANSLILRLIFIRYLIDRGIKIDEDFIAGKTTNDKRKSFSELIKQPQRLNELFTNLNDKFNGVLFKELDILLNQTQSNFLADVFKGELQEQGTLFEGYFFEIFDFSIIPVEVISGIYESLIDEETRELNSAVYTPSFLVDYILNDTVEEFLKNSQTSECSIFEVAVGSGIFLVQSLRRMIEKEIELNGKKDKEAFSNKIRNIAKNNLFGIDINREALKVTCFSIYIALLDYQEPKDVEKYPFPNFLDENLFEANFFDTNHKFNDIVKQNKPRFILGNPPWKNGSKDKIHVQYLRENNLIDFVSDFQLAQSFVLRTKDFKDSFPICSLIITGKSFYNNNANGFKEIFLKNFYLNKILDLSPVRNWIFSNAKNPAMIVNFRATDGIQNTGENIVCYESLKSNVF
uniref:Eco57I restriction-modification methylase domain-containing protein n=1 Tax=Flavobacterium sp. TaxID=239 RepID=UPI0035B425BF